MNRPDGFPMSRNRWHLLTFLRYWPQPVRGILHDITHEEIPWQTKGQEGRHPCTYLRFDVARRTGHGIRADMYTSSYGWANEFDKPHLNLKLGKPLNRRDLSSWMADRIPDPLQAPLCPLTEVDSAVCTLTRMVFTRSPVSISSPVDITLAR